MITLATIPDEGLVRVPNKDILKLAMEDNISNTEAIMRLVAKEKGPVFKKEFLHHVYKIDIRSGLTSVKIQWSLKK